MSKQRDRLRPGSVGEQEKFSQFAAMATREGRSSLHEYVKYWEICGLQGHFEL